MDEHRLHRVARRHLGLFTRLDAAECGFTPFQIRRRISTGEWQTVCGKVLAHRGRQLTPPVLAAAAHLAVPGSVVAGPSAALWYELPVIGSMRWLWLARPRRCRLAGVGRLSDPLLRHDVMRADGVLITGPGRTVSVHVVTPDGDLHRSPKASYLIRIAGTCISASARSVVRTIGGEPDTKKS